MRSPNEITERIRQLVVQLQDKRRCKEAKMQIEDTITALLWVLESETINKPVL